MSASRSHVKAGTVSKGRKGKSRVAGTYVKSRAIGGAGPARRLVVVTTLYHGHAAMPPTMVRPTGLSMGRPGLPD